MASASAPPPSTTNVDSALTALTSASRTDALLRSGLEELVSKERKLAELSMLQLLASNGMLSSSWGGGGNAAFAVGASLNDVPSSGLVAESTLTRAAPVEEVFFDESDALQLPSSAHAGVFRSMGGNGMLRPSSGRPEVSTAEAALLSISVRENVRCGLDLSGMPLGDDVGGSGALSSLMGVLGAGSCASLRALDVRACSLGAGGVSALLDVLRQCPALEALSVEGNTLGGASGQSALVELISRAPRLVHVGITLDEGTPLGVDTLVSVYPPVTTPVGAPARGRTPVRGATAVASSGAPARSMSKGAKGSAPSTHVLPATSVALVTALRANGARVESLSLAGSSLSRDALKRLLSSWTPPSPQPPGATANASIRAKPVPRRPASSAATKSKTAVGAATTLSASSKPCASDVFTPLLALSLAGCAVGSLSALDLAIAMGPPLHALEPHDPTARLGAVPLLPFTANATPLGRGRSSGASATLPVARGRSTASSNASLTPVRPLFAPTLHGSLALVRVLDLSHCMLSSQGVVPLLEAIASHALCLSHLSLRGNALDDAGMSALAVAVRRNHERVLQVMVTADALAAMHASDRGGVSSGSKSLSLGELLGTPPSHAALDSDCFAALERVKAAGLYSGHLTPLRVLDVRDNTQVSRLSRPGCLALVAALRDCDSLLTLCGPMPSPLGLCGVVEGVAFVSGTGENVGVGGSSPFFSGIRHPAACGAGEHFPIDLSAIRVAAEDSFRGGAGVFQARLGSVSGGPGKPLPLLLLPPALVIAATSITFERIALA